MLTISWSLSSQSDLLATRLPEPTSYVQLQLAAVSCLICCHLFVPVPTYCTFKQCLQTGQNVVYWEFAVYIQMLHNLGIDVQTISSICHLLLPFWASSFPVQLWMRQNNKILAAQAEWEEMWTVLQSVRRFPLNCETANAALWRHFSQMICLSLLLPLSPSSLLSQLVCFLSLYPSVYSGRVFFSPISSILFHPSPPTYKTSFYRCTKAAMYFFVSCLFPRLAHVLAVCRPPCFSIPHTSLQSSFRLQ